MDKDFAVIKSEQFPNKLYAAGRNDYRKIWIRDNVYVALAYVESGHVSEAIEIYSGLYEIMAKYTHILNLTDEVNLDNEPLPPRFSVSGYEVPGHWGNKQNDSIGLLLYGVGQLANIDRKYITDSMRDLTQKLINYLEKRKYWDSPDNGIWEDDPPYLHSSSLAACIRGLEMTSSFCDHNKTDYGHAKASLNSLLPRESSRHSVDMALLSLIWPYGFMREELVEAVEANLLRDRGVIRYEGDKYEAIGDAEAQWVMGIPWLGIAHFELGNLEKAEYYLAKTEELYTSHGLPEAYSANNKVSLHNPLAWSHAMAIVLRAKLAKS